VKIPPLRWTLPAGHLLIDVAIVAVLKGAAVAALIDAGNLPAAVLARSSPLLLHEAVAVTIWFLIGLGIDAGRFRLRTEMLAFLAVRLLFVVGTRAASGFWRPATSLELLVWLALAIWGAGWCVRRVDLWPAQRV
jgi:hypothetical protein